MVLWDIRRRHRHNVQTLRQSPVAEISGALGDLGTLLPLMTALAVQGSISLSSTLVFSGLFNMATGVLFGIPLPVQPMKAIAAAAITSHTPLRDTVAAGALVSTAVLVLAATGLLQWLASQVPVPVVKGIQIGAGLSLVLSAGSTLLGPLAWTWPSPFDNRLWALAAFVGLLMSQQGASGSSSSPQRRRRWQWRRLRWWKRREQQSVEPSSSSPFFFPYALSMFLLGLALALAAALAAQAGTHKGLRLPHLALWRPHMVAPRWASDEAWAMAIGQLPLTTLNSVVAVSALADELFGGSEFYVFGSASPSLPWWQRQGLFSRGSSSSPSPAPSSTSASSSVTAFGCSVGIMNLVGCWFGAMPVCHGAGGLAAQYRFGARSGASIVLLGAFKLVLGLFLGETLVGLLVFFPKGILGVLVLASGLELAAVGNSLNYGATDLWEDEAVGGEGRTTAAAVSSPASHAAAATVVAVAVLAGASQGPPLQQQGRRLKKRRVLSSEERHERWTVMLTTAAGILAFRNDAVGFAAGLLCHGAYKCSHWLDEQLGEMEINGEYRPLLS